MKHHLTERQTKVIVALYREHAFRRAMGRSVSSLVERRFLLDSRYAGPLAGLEEAGLVESHRDRVRPGHRSSSLWWLTSGWPRSRRGPEQPLPGGAGTGGDRPIARGRQGSGADPRRAEAAWTPQPAPWWT